MSAVQGTFATLNQCKNDLARSHAEPAPLRSNDAGINALIGELSLSHDRLAKTIGEIEASGEVTLASRIDALTKSKREVEDRLARIFDNFNALDALRKEIGGIFSTIRSNLNRIG